VTLIRQEVTASDHLHADDTPIQVLDPRLRQISGPFRDLIDEVPEHHRKTER
ncbi:hypothetical protein EDC31_1601, partial [Acidomonas methanolica]